MAVIEDCWNYRVDVNSAKNRNYSEFESRVCSLRDDILNKNCFKIQKFSYNNVHSHEDELKCLSEENKQLRSEIDSLQEALTKQKCQYETYKEDQKLLSKEIKDTHEAFLMAKKFYKKYLKIYYTIEARKGDKQTIFVQFFAEAKKDTDLYSIRLLYDTKRGLYQLLESNPKLAVIKEFNKTLQETKDLPGTLYSIREAFIKIKANKNDE